MKIRVVVIVDFILIAHTKSVQFVLIGEEKMIDVNNAIIITFTGGLVIGYCARWLHEIFVNRAGKEMARRIEVTHKDKNGKTTFLEHCANCNTELNTDYAKKKCFCCVSCEKEFEEDNKGEV